MLNFYLFSVNDKLMGYAVFGGVITCYLTKKDENYKKWGV